MTISVSRRYIGASFFHQIFESETFREISRVFSNLLDLVDDLILPGTTRDDGGNPVVRGLDIFRDYF
jgi:hypothetical protein